jgi:hypothetical protein
MIEYITTNGSTGDRFLFLLFWLSIGWAIWEGVPALFKYLVSKLKGL